MWKSLFAQVEEMTLNLFSHVVWILSFLVGTILTAIGYPKEILQIIFWLIMIDLVTKQYSVVKKHYMKFSIRLYFKGWSDRVLTSRILKDGIGVKAMLYLPVLYIAHKASYTQEILQGEAISNILYSFLVIIELISILENFDDAGHRQLSPVLDFLKARSKQILGRREKEGDNKNGSKS